MRENMKKIMSIAVVIALLISLTVNFISARNFEIARQRHISAVINNMHWLSGEIYRAGLYWRDYNAYDNREVGLESTRQGLSVFHASLAALSIHHGSTAGGSLHRLNIILEQVFRESYDPRLHLRDISDKLEYMMEQIYEGMDSQELFNIVDETNTKLHDHFFRVPWRPIR